MTDNFCPNCFEKRRKPGKCPVCGYDDTIEHDGNGYLLPGTILGGKYMVGKVLGHGGFGVTYLGTDLSIQTKIAIKEYMPSGLSHRDVDKISMRTYKGEKGQQYSLGFTRFIKEAKVLSRFNAVSSIVSVYDVFQANGTAYMIMEYLEGETLSSYIKRNGVLPTKEVLRLILPVLDSLEKVHMANVIHRDIALDNLYMLKDGRIKLLDFGAARYAFAEKAKSLSIVLKPGYAPIEQYSRRGAQGPWTDIYALAATMYTMLTCEALPDATDRISGLEIEYPKQIDPHMKKVLAKALSVSGRDRYQNINEFRSALINKMDTRKSVVEDLELKKTDSIDLEDDIDNIDGGPVWWARGKKTGNQTSTNNRTEKIVRKSGIARIFYAKRKPITIVAIVLASVVIISVVFIIRSLQNSSNETIFGPDDGGETQNTPERTQIAAATANPQVVTDPNAVIFSSPLIEKAVRHELNTDDEYVIKEDDLLEITQLLICGDTPFDNLSQYDNFNLQRMVEGEYIPGNGDITSLDDLRQMKNLRILVLDRQKITDISPLVDLPLETLLIDSNMVSDISPLKQLTGLTRLSISDNLVVDATPISSLNELDMLDISFNPITDISFLLGMSIRELWVMDTPIKDYAPLSQLKSLENIACSLMRDEGLKVIGTLESLRSITIFHSTIENLDYFRGLYNLRNLHVGHNDKFSDLSSIGAFSKLQLLLINNTSVNSLEPLKELPMLNHVAIFDLDISDLDVLLELPHLQYVECDQEQADMLRELSDEIQFTIVVNSMYN